MIEQYLNTIAERVVKEAGTRITMVFLPSVELSELMCDLLNQAGMNTISASSYDKDCEQRIQDFVGGKYQCICNSMLLTEGFDHPPVSCVVNLRNTDSRALYCQIVGRGTRIHEGKDNLLVLDFLYKTEHFDICRPSVLFARDKEVAQRMNVELSDELMDLLGLSDHITEEIDRDKHASLIRELEKNRNKKARNICPISFSVYIKSYELMDYEPITQWELAEPPKQLINELYKKGIDVTDITTRGLATKVLDVLSHRDNMGLASPKQVNLLRKYKYVGVDSMSKDQAKKLITLTKNNKWRPLRKYQ